MMRSRAPRSRVAGAPAGGHAAAPASEIAAWRLGLPLLAALGAIALPLAIGRRTLCLRDTLYVHLEMKWAQALAMRAGRFPLIDEFRAGGQPLAGNPNAVPFHPDNLLYLMASPWWSLNAHFWIHLLAAPFAMAALARQSGLSRAGSWAAAGVYAASGFMLAQLSFYNLVAGVAIAPALAAAALALVRGRRPSLAFAGVATLWGLELVAGDPALAVLALVAALILIPFGPRADADRGRAPAPWREIATLVAAIVVGTLLAAPQLTTLWQVLPDSARGSLGYSHAFRLEASWDPRQALEWLIPFAFGRPDVLGDGRFWGHRFFGGSPPLFLSLHPGVLTFGLIAASGRPRGIARAAWLLVLAGIALALGIHDPLVRGLASLEVFSGVRFPVKAWLWVAIGGSLLAGIGFDRLAAGDGPARRRAIVVTLMIATGLAALVTAMATAGPAAMAALRAVIPATFDSRFVAAERLRWLIAGGIGSGLAAIGAGLVAIAGPAPRRGAALVALMGLHGISQVLLLRPLFPTDEVRVYSEPSPLMVGVPAEARVVSAGYMNLFGPAPLHHDAYPTGDRWWVVRQSAWELRPLLAPPRGLHYELDPSPEGLDMLGTWLAQRAVATGDDSSRVRLLASWGVDRLVVDRPLTGIPGLSPVTSATRFGRTAYVYALTQAVPAARLVRDVFPVPNDRIAIELMRHPEFDAATTATIRMPGREPRRYSDGTVTWHERGAERLRLSTEVAGGSGMLVIQRTVGPWRAWVDARPADVRVADLHRIAIEVPPGRHEVRLEVDRAPLRSGLLLALMGAAALAFACLGLARIPPRPPATLRS